MTFSKVYGSQSASRARLLGEVLANLQCELDGRFVWSCASTEMMARLGVELVELDGIVDSLKTVSGAHVVALIVELGPSSFKVSLRALGGANVETVARGFGGGGHDKAAGCRFRGTLEELVAALCTRIEAL